MSFFDPYNISEHTGYYSKKGQVLQKRHVERNPALTLKDKEKAIKILNSFGLKVISNDYMNTEKYTYFAARTLSYENIGRLNSGESFQVKLENMLSFLPTLPIMNQIYYGNVEEINIDCILTGFYLYALTDNIKTNFKIDFGEGIYKYSVLGEQPANSAARYTVIPDTNDGYVDRFYSYANGVGSYGRIAANNATRGQLSQNRIEGDKYLFNKIQKNDLSDARFNASIFEILNNTTAPDDYIDLSLISAFFSVNVEVIYKTYLD